MWNLRRVLVSGRSLGKTAHHRVSWHLHARHTLPYDTHKEAEVWPGDVTCPGSHNWRGPSWGMNTEPPTFFHDTTLTC